MILVDGVKIIAMWCQLMTPNGAETLEVEAVLTDQLSCANIICDKGVLIREKGSTHFRLMPENMCFYSKPPKLEEQ
jgi:hypothetical protein